MPRWGDSAAKARLIRYGIPLRGYLLKKGARKQETVLIKSYWILIVVQFFHFVWTNGFFIIFHSEIEPSYKGELIPINLSAIKKIVPAYPEPHEEIITLYFISSNNLEFLIHYLKIKKDYKSGWSIIVLHFFQA